MSLNHWHKTKESKILLFGVFLTVFLLILGFYYMSAQPGQVRSSALIFLAHLFGGRAAGIGIAIVNGFSDFWTIVYNFYLEVLIVCFTYPITILSINNYLKIRVVKSYARRIESKAHRHKDKLEKYGWLGLFLFVMAPLPVTGPVVGTISGYLLKFSTVKNFSASFLGTLLAVVLWTFFFDYLDQNMDMIRYFLLAIVVVVIFSNIKDIKHWIDQ